MIDEARRDGQNLREEMLSKAREENFRGKGDGFFGIWRPRKTRPFMRFPFVRFDWPLF